MNNFAISSTGIGEALKRSAAALAAGGNTIDESIALITAANNVVQNPDSVGTAMKTYSMYLRAAKAEAEAAGESTEGMANSVSKLRDEIMTLTGGRVDIMESDTTFKSTYQVTKELSQIWDTVSDIDRAAILEKIGGKRNANTLSGLITNFAEAEKVLETSLNSAGSAVQENEKYLDSIAGKTAQLKAAFEDLSTSFLSSDIFKGLIDGGTKVVEILDFIIDKLGGVATVVAGIGIAKVIKSVSSSVTQLGGLGSVINMLTGGEGVSGIYRSLGTIGGGLASSFSAAGVAIGSVAAAIGLISTTIKNVNANITERQADAAKAAEQYQQVADSLDEYKQRIIEIRTELQSPGLSEDMAQSKRAELVDIENQLADAFGREASELDLINGALDSQIKSIDNLGSKSFSEFKNNNRAAIDMAEDYLADLSGRGVWNRTFGPLSGMLAGEKMGIAGLLNDNFQARVFEEFEKQYGKSINRLYNYESGGSGASYGIKVNNAYEMQEYLRGLLDITETLGKAEFGGDYKNKVDYWLNAYSDQLKKVDQVVENNQEIFDTYAKGELATNVEYKSKWSELIAARKEYDDAVLSGNETLQEEMYANVISLQNAFDISKIDDKTVSSYLRKNFDDFKNDNIELAAKMDISVDIDDTTKSVKSAVDDLKKYFMTESGSIDMDLLNNIERSSLLGEFADTKQEAVDAYKRIADAAKEYGLEVEQLISVLTRLGVIQGTVMDTAYSNAQKNFTEITDSLRDAYTEIGDGNAGNYAGIEDDLNRLKLVFYEFADTAGYTSESIETMLLHAGDVTQLISGAYDSFTAQAEKVAAAEETINAAITEQQEAGTITAETYEKLTALGKSYSNILEWNGQALVVNSEAAEKMNDSLREMTEAEAEAVQAAAIDVWERNVAVIGQMSSAYDTLSDESKEYLDSLIETNRELMNQITGFQLLMSQMDFANSGYKKWLDAGSKTDTDKMYSDAVNAYQATQEVFGYTDKSSGKWVKGNRKINSIAFNAASEFLVPEDVREKGLSEVQKYLSGIKKFMQDDQKSVEAFLKSAEKNELMKEEDGIWSVLEGITSDDFIKRMHITKDLFTSLVGDANVYGVEFKFDDENQILAMNDVQDYYEALNKVNKANDKLKEEQEKAPDTLDKFGNVVKKQTDGINDALKEREEALDDLAEKRKELYEYSDKTLENIGVKFEDGLSREEAIEKWLGGPEAELKVAILLDENKGDIQQKIQEYREAFATLANDPNNTEAINKVQQIGTDLKNLPEKVQVAFGIDTTLFDSGIASVSETINDLNNAHNKYQLLVETEASQEEIEAAKAKVDELIATLNKLPPEVKTKYGLTVESGLLNADGTINTDNLFKGLADGTITLDQFKLDLGDTSDLDGTLTKLQNIQSQMEAIQNFGDVIVFVDMFIDEAMAKVGDVRLALDEIKTAGGVATITVNAPNVLMLTGTISNALAEITDKEHNANVTATVIQAVTSLQGVIGLLTKVEGTHTVTVNADTSSAISAINSVQNALDNLKNKTVTVRVNTINNGAMPAVNGSAFAGGNWAVKHGGISLVGELGKELVVDPNTGTWHTVGDYGAEFANIPQGAIVFNHKQTEALLKYGKVAGRGKALVGGTAMVTASGGLWKPSSSSGSSSSVSKQDIVDAVEEGTEKGNEESKKKEQGDGDEEYMSSEAMTELINSNKTFSDKLDKDNAALEANNAVNEKLISYLTKNNFGFTDEELQAILDEAHSRYGSDTGKVTPKKGKAINVAGIYNDTGVISGTNPGANSYALRMRDMNEKWATLGKGNIEDAFGYKLTDSAYTKDTIRAIIEKFFESIGTGAGVNFRNVDEFKKAIANALYNPDYLVKALADQKSEKAIADRIVSQNNLTGDKAREIYEKRLGKYYDSDNTDLWADTLTEKLDELFKGDWYDKLTTEEYRKYTTSDMISSGIEDLVEIFFERLERQIDKIDGVISSSFKNIETRSAASYDKIDMLTKELADKQKAVEVYRDAAAAINLSEDIKKALREGDLRIEDLKGTMSIDQKGSFSTTLTNQKTPTTGTVISMSQPGKDADAESVFKENVSKYQDYYEKYLDTMDDLAKIQESIAEAYQERFDNIQTDFDNRMSLLEHESAMYTAELELLQDRGYKADAGYYDTLKEIEFERYTLLAEEYKTLRGEYETAMASGEIDYGSEAWYELIGAINETDEAIKEVQAHMVEYTNKTRELIWEAFDARQERINVLIDQNEFLMDLIDDSNIFDKDGKITQKGVTYMAVGLDSLRKNLKLARNYGAELEKVTKQLQGDPDNEILGKRAQELREKQQQYILSAKKSAQAINDIELKSLKNLIDNYEDVLSKQKNMRDYQRTLRDKTDDIGNIRKQIEAFSGDTSEDAKRRVQELQKKLKDAEEDLEDAQYDHYIDMQKEMFDELYDEYEEALNRRFDDVGSMMADVASGLEGKADEISGTLHTIAEGVGYIIQYEFDKKNFGDIDLDGLITPEDARLAMRAGVGLEKLSVQQTLNGDLDGDGVVDAADARAIMRVVTKIDTIEQYLRALGIIGYSGGGLVSRTGLAMLHGTAAEPEVVLNASDSKSLMGLRDAMRDMTRLDMLPDVALAAAGGASSAPSIGSIQINIPIDKVEDYNDFIEKMKADDRFSKLVKAASVDLLAGGSSMKRYQI